MKAMIFAAGLGTRLKPLTDTMPKALVPIAGKPLLQWQIEKLKAAGVEDIIVNVHHFPDMIIDFLREHDNFGCNISISDERDQLLDTGGGLRKAWTAPEPILALNVDILSNVDLTTFINNYENLHKGDSPCCVNESSCAGLLVVSERQTQRYLCFDEDNKMCGWTNINTGEIKVRDGKHFAFSGMQILSPVMRDYLAAMPETKFSLIDLYLYACQTENLQAYVPENYKMMDIGKIDHLDEAIHFAESLQVES